MRLHVPARAQAASLMVMVMQILLAVDSIAAKGYHSATYGRTYYHGPTQYTVYFGGAHHYYGTRTWGDCDGDCDQSVYIDQAEFSIAYTTTPDATSILAAKTALRGMWPDLRLELIEVRQGHREIEPTHLIFSVVLPDGSSPFGFSNAVKSCVDKACRGEACTLLGAPPLAQPQCPQLVRVSWERIRAQPAMEDDESGSVWAPFIICASLVFMISGKLMEKK